MQQDIFYAAIEKHREKDHFHMFPYGLADRGDQTDISVVSAPFVEEVGKGAGKNSKKDTNQGINE